jgi:hypothetical protein
LLELKNWFGNVPAASAQSPFVPSATDRSGPDTTCVASPLIVMPKKEFALTDTV